MTPGVVVWITGLPSSGKSTLAERLSARLRQREQPNCVLDSDRIRDALVPAPDYDQQAREGFYQTLANLAAYLAGQGLIVLVPATANRARYRDYARGVARRYLEVYVTTDAQECAQRDDKGLYRAAREGRVTDLPGVGAPFEPPEAPAVRAQGGLDEGAVERTIAAIDACP